MGTAALIVLVLASLFYLLIGENSDEKTARIQSESTGEAPVQRQYLMKQQEEYLRNACLEGEDACNKARQEIRDENCKLFGDDCPKK
jgi:hypothetical protein